MVGAPPHAGLAFGLDRLCTIIGGKATKEMAKDPQWDGGFPNGTRIFVLHSGNQT